MNASSAARRRMLRDTNASERVILVDGIRTSLLEAGSGPPLVLLHGGIECGAAMWAPVIAGLAERYRVIAPDFPGLGESDPFESLDGDTVSSWLSRFLTAVGAQQPVLVAHSLVGSLAARFAADHGDALGSLVIYAAPGIGPYRIPIRLAYVALRMAIRPTPANDERFARFALLDMDATRSRDFGWYDAFSAYSLECAVRPSVKRTMKRLIKLGTKRIPDDDLRSIAVPVDLVWGEGDRMVPRAVGTGASHRLGWPLHVIPNAAHAPHIEQPDDFVETLTSIVAADDHAPVETAAYSNGNPDRLAMTATVREAYAR